MREEKYKNIFDNALIGIYQSTVDGKFITVSNLTQQIYINPRDRQRMINHLKEHDHCTIEVQVKRKDGAIAWVMNRVRAVRDDRGRVVYYEGVVQDITDQKKMEDDLLLMRAKDIMLLDSILLAGKRA